MDGNFLNMVEKINLKQTGKMILNAHQIREQGKGVYCHYYSLILYILATVLRQEK